MDKFFLAIISLVAVVSMVAIVGIVFDHDSQPEMLGVSENRVGYDIYMHSPRGSNTQYPHESDENDEESSR